MAGAGNRKEISNLTQRLVTLKDKKNFFFKIITAVGFLGDTQKGESRIVGTSHINPTECNGTPLQYSCLDNPMDRGAW